jgi:hypothetical protein
MASPDALALVAEDDGDARQLGQLSGESSPSGCAPTSGMPALLAHASSDGARGVARDVEPLLRPAGDRARDGERAPGRSTT